MPSRRQRALITRRLLLGGGAMVPADALVDAVWETEPPKHALHAQVSRLRALLGPEVLLTRAPGYLLATGPHAVDADRFAEGVREAGGLAATDPAGAVALLDELLGLWPSAVKYRVHGRRPSSRRGRTPLTAPGGSRM